MLRWKTEYKKRVYQVLEGARTHMPDQHSAYPGFEVNLVVQIYDIFRGLDPHCEWPYASHVKGSRESCDIHLATKNAGSYREYWFEVGMYASDEEAKYSSNFEKLRVLVDNDPRSLGVLVHFEVFQRKKVLPLLTKFEIQNRQQYAIDVRAIGQEDTIQISRLLIQR